MSIIVNNNKYVTYNKHTSNILPVSLTSCRLSTGEFTTSRVPLPVFEKNNAGQDRSGIAPPKL